MDPSAPKRFPTGQAFSRDVLATVACVPRALTPLEAYMAQVMLARAGRGE